MDIKYEILKSTTEGLLRRLKDYENKTIDNDEALIWHIHDEVENLTSFYKTEFSEYLERSPFTVTTHFHPGMNKDVYEFNGDITIEEAMNILHEISVDKELKQREKDEMNNMLDRIFEI